MTALTVSSLRQPSLVITHPSHISVCHHQNLQKLHYYNSPRCHDVAVGGRARGGRTQALSPTEGEEVLRAAAPRFVRQHRPSLGTVRLGLVRVLNRLAESAEVFALSVACVHHPRGVAASGFKRFMQRNTHT